MNCNCDECKYNLEFSLPDEILQSAVQGNLVIFAGAGISTETKKIFKQTFYQDIREELEIDDFPDFPEIMQMFCNKVNGRRLLLEKLKYRFDYCHQFNELYRSASSFHQELSSIECIDTIITTNWDDYFERECAATPIVTPEDFAFYNVDGRKVLKIHGSIDNYGSIIATTSDYNKCYKNLKNGIIGSYLKTILATKTIVFIGFSFSDFDFNKIYSYLKKEMKDIIPHIYIVTIDESFKEKFIKEKSTIIITDGKFFIHKLRVWLEEKKYLIPKDNLNFIYELEYLRLIFHKRSTELFLSNKTSTNIFNLYYQDGLQHAFDFLIFHSKSGKAFNPYFILNLLESYEEIRIDLSKNKNYQDLVYLYGFTNGIQAILNNEDIDSFPFFYILGKGEITNVEEYINLTKSNEIFHKAGEKYCKKYLFEIFQKDSESDIIPHHRPFF